MSMVQKRPSSITTYISQVQFGLASIVRIWVESRLYAVSEGGNVHLVPKNTGPQRQISTSRRKKKKKKEKKSTPLSRRGEAGDGGGGGGERDKYGLAGVRRLVAGKVHKKSATEKH